MEQGDELISNREEIWSSMMINHGQRKGLPALSAHSAIHASLIFWAVRRSSTFFGGKNQIETFSC